MAADESGAAMAEMTAPASQPSAPIITPPAAPANVDILSTTATPPSNTAETKKPGAVSAGPKSSPTPLSSADASTLNTPRQLVGNSAAAAAGFGYDTFNAGPLITEGPINDQYLVSPGDEIVVSIWGRIVETMNLTVSAEGYIELPDQGGRILTNGVSLRELKPRIVQALSQIRAAYINATDPTKSTAFVDVRLGKLRKLPIYVVGEVNNPGVYTVDPGVANVINLLHNAGGVRPAGTLREIIVRHGEGKTDRVDLYDYFLQGNIEASKIHLVPGDSIMVPLKKKAVTIKGEVRRPNTYEMVGNEGMRELIDFAGGFSPDAYLKQSQIRRFEINRGELIMDIDLGQVADASGNMPLMDGDVVTVAKNIQVRKNSVTIKGEGITRSGSYEWTPGMKLADLIAKADGLRDYAYLERADLIRTEDDFSKKLTVLSLNDLYQRGDNGQFLFADNPEKNIPLREMDEIVVQSAYGMQGKDPQITLEGHVKEPGKYPLARGMTLYDLLFARGGFQDATFRKSTYLARAHIYRAVPGEVGKKILNFNLGDLLDNKDSDANLPLEEDDVIHIYASQELAKQQLVKIEGLVDRPGDYPYAENMSLRDLLVVAGGLRPGTERGEAIIARPDIEGNSRSMVVPISTDYTRLPKEQRTLIQPGDKITVVGLAGQDRFVSLDGFVKSPGKYILTKDMTLFDLVSTRGGFQDLTFRRKAFPDMAHVLRKTPGDVGTRIIPFNLGALLDNKPDVNLALEEDDVIRIYSYEEMRTPQIVRIDGLVKKPGSFPLAEGMSLEDLIMMAGGLLPEAFRVEAAIARSEKADITGNGALLMTTLKVPVSLKDYASLPAEQRTLLKADDRVTIRAVPGWEKVPSVQVEGEVNEPGNFSLQNEAETISSLILRAGGLKKQALPEGAIVKRKKGIVTMSEQDSPEYYDITVNLPLALANPGSADDIVLKGDDRLFIPTNPGIVEVRGAVKRPLTLQHLPERSLEDYISLCGGYLDKADPANLTVFAANKVAITQQVRGVTSKSAAKNRLPIANKTSIPAGSVIEVPFLRETERMMTVEVKGAVAKPALIQHVEGAPLGYYLNLSGGFSHDADLDQISILLPNGGLLIKTENQPFNPIVPGGSLIMVSGKSQPNQSVAGPPLNATDPKSSASGVRSQP
jgi:protein involved in polysaccharide export with SLBB domain